MGRGWGGHVTGLIVIGAPTRNLGRVNGRITLVEIFQDGDIKGKLFSFPLYLLWLGIFLFSVVNCDS